MRIVAYCRVSTDKEDQLNSLEAQKAFFEEYAVRNGHELVHMYVDEGITGTRIKNRKQFQQMMKDAELKMFDMLVCKDISRLGRNTIDVLDSVRKLKDLKIETQFITVDMTSMGNSEFLLTILAALAQEESANMSKRVKFGKKINAEKGRVPTYVYGYNKIKGDYFNLEINHEEAETVKQIFRMYNTEGLGMGRIAHQLNQQGKKTKRNCEWSAESIAHILHNALYTGTVINGKSEIADFLSGKREQKDKSEWMIVENPNLQIISKEEFAETQRILAERRDAFNQTTTRESNKYRFSTLIKCRECGWSFRRFERTYKNTYVRWICSGRNRHGTGSCPNKTKLDDEELTLALQEYFSGVLATKKNVLEAVISEFERKYKKESCNALEMKRLQKQIEKIDKTRTKYMTMFEDDLVTREELKEKLSGMIEEKAALEAELNRHSFVEEKGYQLRTVLQATFKSIADFADVSKMSNMQLRRIIDCIEVDKDGNVDIFIKPVKELGLPETVHISQDRAQGSDRAASGTE